MGRELAILFAKNNYKVGIIGRRENLLIELTHTYPDAFIAQILDISKSEAPIVLDSLVRKLGGLDILVMTAGFGEPYERLNNHVTQKIIQINVTGFTNVIDWGLNLFIKQGKGHLVSFSSVAGIRGFGIDPAYCASNSFQMNYLEGLRQNIHNTELPISITDVRPGFVEKNTSGVKTRFLITSLDKATQQIYQSIIKKKKVVYVSRRWAIVALLLTIIPRKLYLKILSQYIRKETRLKESKVINISSPSNQSLVS